MSSLPAYITNKPSSASGELAQRGLALVGTGAGPYLSIESNRFTLVDSAGNTKPFETLYADVVIIDLNDHVSKMYYDSEWDPNDPKPPACFSDNGLAPSVGASSPQSPTCAGCEKNVWGSKISKMGSKVKACRDEMKGAIIIPGMPGNMFRLTVPPNSLTNFRAYLAKFQNAGFDLADVVTRLSFEQGVQGTLVFAPAPNPWLDEPTLEVRNKAIASKGSDILVGRLDRPRQGLIAGPTQPAAAATTNAALGQQLTQSTEPAPGAQQDAFGQQTQQPSASAQPAGAPAEPQRRRRRTQEQIAADNAAAGQQAGTSPASGPAMAPFRPAQTNGPATVAPAQPGAFGIQQGVAPDPALAGAIADIFGN